MDNTRIYEVKHDGTHYYVVSCFRYDDKTVEDFFKIAKAMIDSILGLGSQEQFISGKVVTIWDMRELSLKDINMLGVTVGVIINNSSISLVSCKDDLPSMEKLISCDLLRTYAMYISSGQGYAWGEKIVYRKSFWSDIVTWDADVLYRSLAPKFLGEDGRTIVLLRRGEGGTENFGVISLRREVSNPYKYTEALILMNMSSIYTIEGDEVLSLYEYLCNRLGQCG